MIGLRVPPPPERTREQRLGGTPCGNTYTCENITSRRTSCAGGNKISRCPSSLVLNNAAFSSRGYKAVFAYCDNAAYFPKASTSTTRETDRSIVTQDIDLRSTEWICSYFERGYPYHFF